MKRVCAITLGVFLLTCGLAHAAQPADNCGCGVGTMIFEGKDGLIWQVFAATTNGCFGNQTFGITSGTLECEKAPSFASNEELNRFVADNMDNLVTDIAQGEGEYLDSLAELIGVPQQDRTHFNMTLQAHFSEIFSSETVSHVDVLENIAKIYPIA